MPVHISSLQRDHLAEVLLTLCADTRRTGSSEWPSKLTPSPCNPKTKPRGGAVSWVPLHPTISATVAPSNKASFQLVWLHWVQFDPGSYAEPLWRRQGPSSSRSTCVSGIHTQQQLKITVCISFALFRSNSLLLPLQILSPCSSDWNGLWSHSSMDHLIIYRPWPKQSAVTVFA